MPGPRSNYSMLPYDLRVRIVSLLHDGATYDAVLADDTVRAGLTRLGLTLTASALSRVRRCAEYKKIAAQRENMRAGLAADRLTAGILRDASAAESIGENVKVDLLRIVRDCVSANPDDPREVERLVRSAVNLTNPAKDAKILTLEKKLHDAESRVSELENALETAKKEFADELARVRSDARNVSDPAKVADELAAALGVKK